MGVVTNKNEKLEALQLHGAILVLSPSFAQSIFVDFGSSMIDDYQLTFGMHSTSRITQ
jgi:hypothetical protein